MLSWNVRGSFAAACLALLATGCATRGERLRVPEQSFNNPPDCACTLEYRMNLCVTVNGSETIPDSLSFLREQENGSQDALEYNRRCFGELRGTQRILMLRDSVVIDSSAWFTIRTADCCHGEARTVDFGR